MDNQNNQKNFCLVQQFLGPDKRRVLQNHYCLCRDQFCRKVFFQVGMMWLGKGCPKYFKMINQQYLKNDPFLVLRFSYYTFLIDVICGAAIYAMLMILLSILNVSRHVICWNNLSWLLNLNLIYDTVWAGTGSSLLILVLQKLNWFRLTGQHWCYWCENGWVCSWGKIIF